MRESYTRLTYERNRKLEEKFNYLESHPNFRSKQFMPGEYIDYKFSEKPNDDSYDFCICIPNLRGSMLYTAYNIDDEITEFPTWFQEIHDEVERKIDARDRLKDLFDVD